MILLFIWIALLFTPKFTLSQTLIDFGIPQIINQDKTWNYFKINPQQSKRIYTRIWLQIISKPSDAFPVLAISDNFPSFGNADFSINTKKADYEGWYSGLTYQSIFLQSTELTNNTYIGIGNSQFYQGQISYTIGADSSDDILCPKNDCNDRGACITLGKCACKFGYIGPSCDIKAYKISSKPFLIENGQSNADYGYIDLKNVSSQKFDLKIVWNNENLGEILLNYDGNLPTFLPSSVNNCSSMFLSKSPAAQTLPINKSGKGRYLYLLFILNKGQPSSLINYTIYYTEKSDSSNEFILIYIIISVLGVFILLSTTIIIIWKKWKKERVRIALESPGLSSTLVNKNYPAMKYQDIKNKKGIDTTCAICFEAFKLVSIVRKLHCNHLFHGTCIEEWFKANRTCCLCKRDCSVMEEGEFNTSSDEIPVEKAGTRGLTLRRISVSHTQDDLNVRDIL
ncbi:unnamed protein product [Blepharisma stoltei]|uniref:RING-type domain-containing protein n=1 Tax=Blepharisma stoltei TaxID=1481888 RepID=A0AAU9J7G9_9CILI|nr:unnamed protein product [Blepharisma stoltei]